MNFVQPILNMRINNYMNPCLRIVKMSRLFNLISYQSFMPKIESVCLGQTEYILFCSTKIVTLMGVLAPRSAHARPSAQPPINMRGNFPAHVSAESLFWNFPIFRSKKGYFCHLHNSSGMCLHLARTNHVSAESPSNISPNTSEVISEVSKPKGNFWNFQKKIKKT